ncbi:exodeoxyribonuclease VII small subunit [Methylohalomonas lacus]|uniref:Exodeoxyribonuclease 7 small subunit n=1 Tax=Methylohalomonas lacus TaxID=398773 RepID=A0AAE3HKE6_9GAMM|nr:exodeoxyribonuclease VII small subunit [Methylohalomonas lacus]MCS3902729.1 exodeoxyribonuclease VII small subunit [Methylohalomonas lacus]
MAKAKQNSDSKPAADPAAEKFDFEAALAELEQLVERMEQGELSLEESLQQFERGIALTRACQQALQAAEQKVQILLNETPEAELSEFDSDSARDKQNNDNPDQA